MAIFNDDPIVILHKGDALDVLGILKSKSVHCIVTSPPYWGLRKYSGVQERVWGGKDGCEHEWSDVGASSSRIRNGAPGGLHEGQATNTLPIILNPSQGSVCLLCGAWRGAYGLESLHDCVGWARGERCNVCYLCHTLAFLDALWRVLRGDGVCFWNLGDSYAGGGSGQNGLSSSGSTLQGQTATLGGFGHISHHYNPRSVGLKPKDLVLIPQRVALAAQASGWGVRSMIVWAKPNQMPESVTDRPTSAYEHVLMLTKSPKYFWDQEAVRENLTSSSLARLSQNIDGQQGSNRVPGKTNGPMKAVARGGWDGVPEHAPGRNLRDVWTIPTQPYTGAHFATFPEALVERCILAATSEHGVCNQCGAPWVRVVLNGPLQEDPQRLGRTKSPPGDYEGLSGYRPAQQRGTDENHGTLGLIRQRETLSWRPSCPCEGAGIKPGVVLDPFAGSGTTLAVAKRLGRQSVGIELSDEYCRLAVRRIEAETARML